ncbi:MAG: type II secretion system secretin GspD [Desulfovibrionaceae bacterium]|jgi:general secretion pathway protein D|nr:type II secretion system secretin GspD [Desulfovibrionaceae bacterium]
MSLTTSGLRRVFFAVLAVAVLGAALALQVRPVRAQPPAGDQSLASLQANLDNVELEDFIKFIGKYTGRNIIYRADQIPKTTFNIYSSNAIDEPQLMAIFSQLLDSVGLEAVSRGDALHILPLVEAKKLQPVLKQGATAVRGAEDELVVTVYQLGEDVEPTMAAALIKGMQSPLGLVQEIPQARSILIRDKRERIQKMLSVLRTVLNVRPEWKTMITSLKFADCESVVKMIQGMYAEFVKRGRTADVPMVQAIPWSNSIFFAGSEEQKKDVADLIAKLDHVEQATSGYRVFRLQNAKATSVAEVLTSLVSVLESTAGTESGAADAAKAAEKAAARRATKKQSGSESIQASADEDTNSVVVIAGKEVMPQVEEIIKRLDQPQDQVYIEALIMETTLENAREFGVEWMAGAGGDSVGTIGFVDEDSSTLASYADPVYGSTSKAFPSLSSIPGGFSLGVLGHIITYGDKKYPTMGALINFAKSATEINILSTPQIMTLANSEAEIFVGENRPYKTSTQYDSEGKPVISYDYRDVGIKLVVKPYVNEDSDLIKLDIEQNVDRVAENSASSDAPTTLTRYTKTSVQILDGSTVVIGGLIRDDGDKSKSGMPGLATLPYVGWLFKRESNSGTKSTLMVFVSAHIIRSLDNAQRITRNKMQEAERARGQSKDYFTKEFETKSLGGIFSGDDEQAGEGADADRRGMPDDGPVSVTEPGPGAAAPAPSAPSGQDAPSND